MSVGIKTPTQFSHQEFPCGGIVSSVSSGSSQVSTSSSSTIHKNECGKDNMNNNSCIDLASKVVDKKPDFNTFRKRRFSRGSVSQEAHNIKKRRHSAKEKMILPSKFLLGGNINDPLNLNSVDLDPNSPQMTPVSSPLPVPAHRRKDAQIKVIIPQNISDPLGLNNTDDNESSIAKKKKRSKHKKKSCSDASLNIEKKKDDPSPDEPVVFFPGDQKSNVTKPLTVDVNLKVDETLNSTTSNISSDSIVSPVIPQLSPKNSRKRKRNDSIKSDISDLNLSSVKSESTIDSATPGPSGIKRSHSTPKFAPMHKKSSKKPKKFIYGNYNRYYGYRNPDISTDNRLDCIRKDWIEGMNVLDIGCNVGHVTLALARDFNPHKITGIDIDGQLIEAAKNNIKNSMKKDPSNLSKFPVSMASTYGPISNQSVPVKASSTFPDNISFLKSNYVLECDELLDLQQEEYDVIIALSVTKWIHLNWGDAGLKRFFKRIGKQLRPGGKLILEPQAWPSYKKKKKLTDEIHKNFLSIKFKPEHFNKYLLSSEVGFIKCEVIDTPYNKSHGFRRAIQVFTKATPSIQGTPYYGSSNANTPVVEFETDADIIQNRAKVDTPDDEAKADAPQTDTNNTEADTPQNEAMSFASTDNVIEDT